MITVVLQGGVGNQMFQYAYALAIQRDGWDVVLDDSFVGAPDGHVGADLTFFRTTLPIVGCREWSNPRRLRARLRRRLQIATGRRMVIESVSRSAGRALQDGQIVEGFFLGGEHLRSIERDVRIAFQPAAPLSEYGSELRLRIDAQPSVSIHVRRGDYLLPPDSEKFALPSAAYYRAAMQRVAQAEGPVKPFVFSDDIDWAERSLNIDDAVFVEPGERHPAEDLYLMSRCSHNIMANSTFSWWAAWLNDNQNKIVVAPAVWFQPPEPPGPRPGMEITGWHLM